MKLYVVEPEGLGYLSVFRLKTMLFSMGSFRYYLLSAGEIHLEKENTKETHRASVFPRARDEPVTAIYGGCPINDAASKTFQLTQK